MLAAGCDSNNVGGPIPVFFTAAINAPTGSAGGNTLRRLDSATWSVSISGGNSPYYVAWNFGGGATPNSPFSESVVGSLSSTTVQMSAEGSFTASVTVTGANGASIGASFDYTVLPPVSGGNHPPVAVLGAVPQSGSVPLTVQFSAAGSSDSDGSIVLYEWDLDGDGSYELSGTASTQSRIYTVAGSYQARLRVTDNGGLSAVSTITIIVSATGTNISPTAVINATPLSGAAPLDVQFSAAGSSDSDGSIVSYEWDYNGDGVYNANTGTVQTANHTYTVAGTYSARLRVTDNGGAVGLASITITVTGGATAPTVSLGASPSSGNAPLTVTLTANASLAGGSITRYQWDFQNDGTYDFDSGSVNSASFTYTVAGVYTVRVLVTGSNSLTATDSVVITVNSGFPGGSWTGASTVAATNNTGHFNSLAIVNGNPAIAYRDETTADLYYIRANDALGSSWSSPVLVDGAASSAGAWCSLAVINGNPAISYYDETNLSLRYAYSSSSNGTSLGDWTNVLVDTGYVGTFSSLALINGFPAISYRDETNNNLKYAWSSQANGSSGWNNLTIDGSSGWSGAYTSLALVNNRPAIAYNKGNALRYAYSSQADGSSGWTALTVDNDADTGWWPSLTVVDGRPAIAYHRYSSSDLKYAWSSTVTGDSAGSWSNTTLVSGHKAGEYASLQVAFGHPCIAYYNTTDGQLHFIYSSSVTGQNSGDWTNLAVAGIGGEDAGQYSSLAVLGNGYPAIAYRNRTQGDLQFVRFN